MWDRLPLEADIEQVFNGLQDKAVEFARPWSGAELQLTEAEVQWFRDWFRNVHLRIGSSAWGKKRTMLGAILVVLGAEVCRRESREDSVWPKIGGLLPRSSALWSWMFYPANGQPTVDMTEGIADGVRALNLRNVIDQEGVQQWFSTIKLQFGFTLSGVRNRLPEWLAGYGRPHSVDYLIGQLGGADLESKTFLSLWKALIQYRRGDIDEEQALLVLRNSPWVLPDWGPLLLKKAREKIELGYGDRNGVSISGQSNDSSSEGFNPIVRVLLDWPPGKEPRLRFELDREGILQELETSDTNELTFHVDGRRICQWRLQSNGSWSGSQWLAAEQETQAKQPNLRPHTLTVCSGAGDILFSWDFADCGLSEDILVFNLDDSGLFQPEIRLHSNRNYALVCGKGCVLTGCEPIGRFQTASRVVFRLPSPLNENIALQFSDFVLWQPVRSPREPDPVYSVLLQTPPGRIYCLDDRTELHIDGLPHDASEVRLLLGQKTHDLVRHAGGSWRTTKSVSLTPDLAAK